MVTNSRRRFHFVPPPAAAPPPPAEPVFLTQVLRLLVRRKLLVSLGVVAGVALAILYYSRARPVYEARAQILVIPKDARLPTQGERDPVEDGADSNSHLATHVELFRSPQVINRAVEEHHLERLASLASLNEPLWRRVAGEEWSAKIAAWMKSPPPAPRVPLETIAENLTVSRGGIGAGKEAHVLVATFRGPSPDDSAAVLAALVESYQHFLDVTLQDTSGEAVRLVNQAKQELEADLAQAEEAYCRFREEAPLVPKGSQQASPHEDRIIEVERALTEVRLHQARLRTRLEVVRAALDDDGERFSDMDRLALIGNEEGQRLVTMLTAVRGDPGAATLLSQLLGLVVKQEEVNSIYLPSHPESQKIRAQVEGAQGFLRTRMIPETLKSSDVKPSDMLAAYFTMLENDQRELAMREKELLILADQEEKEAKAVVSAEVRNDMLRADLLRKRAMCDALIERLKRVSLVNDYGGYLTNVITPVEVPSKPVSPILAQVLILGGLLGMFCGVGLAYAVDRADRTFHGPDDVQRALGLPLLAEVPPIRPAKRPRRRKGEAPERRFDGKVVAYYRPESREAEALRALRAALHIQASRRGMKVIQVTSPGVGDGKTTLTVNLAFLLAQSGKRVLLVDADLRNPSVHRMLGIELSPGLSGVIADEAEWPDAIQASGVANLSVLPAGSCSANPSDLLMSQRFEHFLELAREQFDYVLVDSPPLLAVSDASVIAPRTDGVLLALRITRSGAPKAAQAKRMLAGTSARTLGVVVNGFKKSRSYHYGPYGACGEGYGQNGHAKKTVNGEGLPVASH